MLFPTLGPSSLPVVVAQAASVLQWYMTDMQSIVQHLAQTKKNEYYSKIIKLSGLLKYLAYT